MKNKIIIRQPANEEELEAMFFLRWFVLRKPWNQPEGSEKDDLEDQAIPIIALMNDQIVGTARLQRNSEKIGQIRYMAVDTEYQRKGIGKSIILTLHQMAKTIGLKKIILDARELSLGFYTKLGYKITKKSYLLFGEIQHWQMEYLL